MHLSQYRLEGLGHLSTLIGDEDAGVVAVVDPRRDVDVYLAAAAAAGLRISHVLETHLHNDYVSGASDLAALTGATHVIGAGAGIGPVHRPVSEGAQFDVGSLRFTTRDTPGHTPEHVAYAVADLSRTDDPAVLLTGGSLLVGAVGRTDLLGAEHAHDYARSMHHSLHDVILRHEDYVTIYPTHGAGSLCSSGIAATPSSTIGFERRHDPLLAIADVDEFAHRLLTGQPTIPRYFARMRPLNQAGPPLLGGRVPEIPALVLAEVQAALAGGAQLIDTRSVEEHAAGHPPGALSIPSGSSFGTWLGWVVDPERALVLIVADDDPVTIDDLARQAVRIGCDRIIGRLAGGFAAWTSAGLAVEAGPRRTVAELAQALAGDPTQSPLLIDVRQRSEFEEAHVPGSVHLTAGSLLERLAELPRGRPIDTICASGYRASVAASLLRANGFRAVRTVEDGVPAWQAAGYPIATGNARD